MVIETTDGRSVVVTTGQRIKIEGTLEVHPPYHISYTVSTEGLGLDTDLYTVMVLGRYLQLEDALAAWQLITDAVKDGSDFVTLQPVAQTGKEC